MEFYKKIKGKKIYLFFPFILRFSLENLSITKFSSKALSVMWQTCILSQVSLIFYMFLTIKCKANFPNSHFQKSA